jgi:TolC family type I secretion outer membrane protein
MTRIRGLVLVLLWTLTLSSVEGAEESSLTLDDCIGLAVRNHPSLLAYACEVDQSRASVNEARADLLPTLSASASYGRASSQHGSDAGSYGASLQVKGTLFQGGQALNSLSAAGHSLRAAEYDYESALQDLVLDIRTKYYQLLQKERIANVSEMSIRQSRLHLDLAQRRFDVGVSSRADVLKAQVEVSNAALSLIQARNAEALARGELNSLLGLPVDEPTVILDVLEEPSVLLEDRVLDALVCQAEAMRPEIAGLSEQLEAQRARVNASMGGYFPSVSAQASYGWDGGSLSDLESDWSVGLSLSLPLFDGFSTGARVAGQRARLDVLLKTQESLRRSVELAVYEAQLSTLEARDRIQNTEIQVESALENLEIAEAEYRRGEGSMLELVDAQTEYVKAREECVSAQVDLWIARAALDRAVGVTYPIHGENER